MTMKKFFLFLNLLSVCLVFGCSKDELNIDSNEFGSSVEVTDHYKISQFTISNRLLQITKQDDNIEVELTSRTNGDMLTFEGEIRDVSETVTGAMFIPTQTQIADSDYDVIFRDSNGDAYGARLVISIKDEMFCGVLEEKVSYSKLTGTGNMDSPYQIASTDDYRVFLSYLLRDSLTHGANLYFEQTATFDAPIEGIQAENEGYVPLPFAGNYNGNKHTIEMFRYDGANGDKNVGLFSELLDNAYIQDLKVVISNIKNTGTTGAIAGSTKGNVTLSNVIASGSLYEMNDQVGGLVGYASSGKLTIQNSHSYVSIDGVNNKYAGGLIGRVGEDATVSLQNDSITGMSIAGASYVGGAIGHLEGAIDASHILISHPVDDGKTKVIEATSHCVGGFIGSADIKGESSISNVLIEAPVEGDTTAGGLIGYITTSDYLAIKGCRITNTIKGSIEVGGLIGKVESNGKGVVSFGKLNSLAVQKGSLIYVQGDDKSENVGGIIGRCQEANLDFTAPISIGVDVSGGVNVGGFFGSIIGGDETNFVISDTWRPDNAMTVSGIRNVGGYVGYMDNVTLQDKMEYTLKTSGVQERLTGVSAYSGAVGVPCVSEYCGGIVGNAKNSTLQNILVTGTVSGLNYDGGILGYGTNTNIYSCVSSLSEFGCTGECNGGIVGFLIDSDIDNCVNYSTISQGTGCSGGIAGNCQSRTKDVLISRSVNVGAISGSKDVGGLVGQSDTYLREDELEGTCVIENSANYGSISGIGIDTNNDKEVYGLGGVLGSSYYHMRIEGCANHGNVSGSKEYHGVGGVCGSLGVVNDPYYAFNTWTKMSCNFGTISAEGASKLGGVVGFLEDSGWAENSPLKCVAIHYCYNMGAIPSDCKDDTGGVLGCMSKKDEIICTYNVGKVSYGNAVIGTHTYGSLPFLESNYGLTGSGKHWKETMKSEEDMKNLDKLPGFTTDIWQTDPNINDGYPYLIDCPFQFVKFTL